MRDGIEQNLSVEARKTMQEQGSADQPKIHVDEDWKKSIAEEKARAREQEQPPKQERSATQAGSGRPRSPFPEPSIQVFLAGLYAQTLVALGELENPATGRKARDIEEAAYMVDTIAMLQAKTRGNLSPEEESYVQNVLTDLRMRYVNAAKEREPEGDETDAQQA